MSAFVAILGLDNSSILIRFQYTNFENRLNCKLNLGSLLLYKEGQNYCSSIKMAM